MKRFAKFSLLAGTLAIILSTGMLGVLASRPNWLPLLKPGW